MVVPLKLQVYCFVLENDKTHEDVHHLLAPLEKVKKLDIHAVTPLLEFIRNEQEEKLGSGGPRSILTSLRLLKHLMQTNKDSKNTIISSHPV